MISPYLTGWNQFVDKVEFLISSGVPQGSILGPLFLNLFINDLPCCMTNSKVFVYAYDTLCSHNLMLLQNDLLNLHQWCDENKMKFNVSKTKLLHFPKSIEAKNVPVCILNGEDISITHEEVKDLTIKYEFSSKLIMHSNERIKNAHKSWISRKR